MLNTEHDRAGADEQYIMATNASDLTVDSNKVTAVDFLIEAGLVGNRMGAILIHLAGEWAAADKPPKLGDADIVALAELLPRLNAKGKLDMKKARAIGIAGRAREFSASAACNKGQHTQATDRVIAARIKALKGPHD